MSKSNDQNYKNLILDYPIQSIQFFAPQEAKDVGQSVKITPIRQEQLKDRLGDRFRELDTPLLVEWPDGRRESIVFVNEQESDKYRFSIHRMVIYCTEISRLLKTNRVVPVVIFTSSGNYPQTLNIGTELHTFLTFNYIACNLNGMNAHDYMNSDNLVARLNLPLMCYNKEDKVEVYAQAVDGLISLEHRQDYQLKYIDFIDQYANLDESELEKYKSEYAEKSNAKEEVMGLLQHTRDEGIQQGIHQEGVNILTRLLKKKFGSIPEDAETRISQADSEQLLEWSENVLTAETVNEVFH
jgi:hypothetical protein